MDYLESTEESVCPISGETPNEELWNYRTHLFGFLYSIIESVYLIAHSFHQIDNSLFWGIFLFCLSEIFVYYASSRYHKQTDLRKKILYRKIDYVSIYFAILGYCAPFLLGPLKGFFGIEMFFLLLVLTGLGSIFKLTLFDKFLPFSLSTYCLISFLPVCHVVYLQSLLPGWSLFYIILKIFFSLVGLVFFRWDSLPYNHSIWHLMVLAGSFSFFMSILHLLNI